jgi:hypothetical protein
MSIIDTISRIHGTLASTNTFELEQPRADRLLSIDHSIAHRGSSFDP